MLQEVKSNSQIFCTLLYYMKTFGKNIEGIYDNDKQKINQNRSKSQIFIIKVGTVIRNKLSGVNEHLKDLKQGYSLLCSNEKQSWIFVIKFSMVNRNKLLSQYAFKGF